MLTEQFIASVGVPNKAPVTHQNKDAAILAFEYQPLVQQRVVFKKSATPPKCLAVSDTHIFAAQVGKAVVHVYSRLKGNQEATVPFTESITSVTLASDNTILILGTAEGRIFLWETSSGRLISTAQSHLQSITGLVVDLASNFLLSVSADSTAQVWSLPYLLSFSRNGTEAPTPLHTFGGHRSAIRCVAVGHSTNLQNIAITASQDKTCLIWDYCANSLLATILLTAIPTCIELESADRAAYVGFEDGSLQQLPLIDHTSPNLVRDITDPSHPIQPDESKHWSAPEKATGALWCLDISFDGATVLSGHQSGTILAWDVASGHVRSLPIQPALPGPVTNLKFLPVSGFLHQLPSNLVVESIIKPKFGAFAESFGDIPGNYSVSLKFPDTTARRETDFSWSLTTTAFPQHLLDEGLRELDEWTAETKKPLNGTHEQDITDDFMSLSQDTTPSQQANLENQNSELKQQLEALRRVQFASFQRMETLQAEKKELLRREQRILSQHAGPQDPLQLGGAESPDNEASSASEID